MDTITAAAPQRAITRARRIAVLFMTGTLGAFGLGQPVQAAGPDPSGGDSSEAALAGCGTTSLYKADGSAWSCSFSDDFSGSSVDPTKWLTGTTEDTGYYVGDSCILAKNVSVSNGTLRITSRDLGRSFTCRTPSGSFRTRNIGGAISTNGRWVQTYGRFEARARFPQSGAGANAFWLYPELHTYGGWPHSGEIDVAEWWSRFPNLVLPSLHYSGSTSDDSGWSCSITDPTAWHTYAVVWEREKMSFSIDGTVCFTRSWTPDAPLIAPQPFDRPFMMTLTAGVDGDSSSPATTTTRQAATYEVDYVRAWK